ncbi:MAG TPA: PSD1 and planctomycete cytochrome C domain-containing protein [Bryobacteraceae bacterium]|nr:PSD1 and planctomycete cytochrome C domain-containing protein [Bryobacteraceae bacterium]
MWPVAFFFMAAGTFDSAVLPVFRAKCFACHSGKVQSGGLSLESRNNILRGGKSGSAIVPGKPVDSLLMTLVSGGKMPLGGEKLNAAEMAAIRTWIEGEDQKAPVAERDVTAILSAKCWVCHGRRDKMAGLDLRTRVSMLTGGKSGPVVVAGKPEESLLVKRIVAQEMPPPKLQEQFSVRGLTDEELAKVRQWIADGAPPDNERAVEVSVAADPAIKAKDREFWAFRTPVRPTVAAGNSIDALMKEQKPLAPPASDMTLLRRAYFALIGLPPTPEEVEAFRADSDPRRYEKLVDRLLDSPRYGERWARHWLDAVGYTDSEGGNSGDQLRPHAWRYRDYVIRSLNENRPYDRFLTEQIAGDELFDYKSAQQLTPNQIELVAATGFWRTAPDSTYSTEQNFIPERMDVIAGQLEVLGSAVMGLSVGCARCHDHKYDPIPTRDYYRLVSILTPAYDPYHWLPPVFPCGGVGAKCDENSTRYFLPKATQEWKEVTAFNAPINQRLKELQQQIEDKAAPYREKYLAERKVKDAKLGELEAAYEPFKKEKAAIDEQILKEKANLKVLPLVRALLDLGPEPPPTRILMRGDATSPGALVTPGVPSILNASTRDYRLEPLPHSTGRRLALAKWLTHPGHPLTARVMVNRIWQHHFGVGLVATPGNFGRMGSLPTNQRLLDWLATEFVRSGWDIKAMHRLVMTSATYRQQSGDNGFPLRRMDAESVRDSILQIAGKLEAKAFGPADAIKAQPDGEVITASNRRSIYVTHRRTQPVSLLETFDQPFMNPNCVKRGLSVVSSQALHLMNGDLARENSRFMAGRIIDAVGDDPAAQIERAYLLALARKPTTEELRAARNAMDGMSGEWSRQLEKDQPAEPVKSRGKWLALATVCHTLINSAEFLYID